MTTISLRGRGARGESLADVARRTGSIAGVAVPSDATDAEIMGLLTGALSEIVAAEGYSVIDPVRVATSGNITLSGAQTIDGVSVVATNRVLVKNQSTAADNGIYVAAAGAWSRATDFDQTAEVVNGAYVTVSEGSVNAGSAWVLTTADPITVGTTAQTWRLFRTMAAYATKAGAETLTNKSFSGGVSFFTNGSRIGITNDASALTPSAMVEMANNGVVTCGLRVSSRWTGTTATPYQNNDNSLWETFNTVTSDSENYSWSISAPNAYNDIPAGVHDSGERVGVYGWATSVNVPGSYDHDGWLTSQIGVRGRAGFQGDSNPSPATARISKAVGVKGEVRNDSPLATINLSIAGEFSNIAPAGVVENNIGVYSNVTLGTTANWSFFGEAGELFNEDRAFFGEGTVSARQSACIITARGTQPNALEFGHPDATGFGSNLGRTAGSGYPFLAFCAEADVTGNTFTTRGKKGAVVYSDLAGALIFARVATATATGQSLTECGRFTDTGQLTVASSIKPSSYTVGTVPSASAHGAGAMIYVSNETGGAVIAFSDATNWLRVTDRAVIA